MTPSLDPARWFAHRSVMKARLYQRPKSSMSSGRARVGVWLLEYEPVEKKRLDPLTGWSGSGDTQAQVQLSFADQASAIAYAEAHGLEYELKPLGAHTLKLQAYADNFR